MFQALPSRTRIRSGIRIVLASGRLVAVSQRKFWKKILLCPVENVYGGRRK